MNKLIFIILFFVSCNSFAYFDLGIGYSYSSKNNLEEGLATRGILGFQMSYDWYDLNLGLELNRFSESEDQLGLASVSRKYFDLTPWARYNFVNTDRMDVFFGVGSGVYQEKINISLSDVGDYSGKSELHWLLSGAVGIKGRISHISGVIEYRISRRMAEDQQSQSLRLSTNYSF